MGQQISRYDSDVTTKARSFLESHFSLKQISARATTMASLIFLAQDKSITYFSAALEDTFERHFGVLHHLLATERRLLATQLVYSTYFLSLVKYIIADTISFVSENLAC